ncbi:MAG: UvrD-helicase domain-containing protein [Deltaproteobacteria bacterium]|nr:UvrD-helicase domain-containing protein [Deltaproteobacteria bacterium]
MDLLDQLNPPQRAAVEHGDGPLLVFAGAGSGKTRVITHRIAHKVAACGVPAWNILAVTFTNKAAKEMRQRVERLLGTAGARDAWIGTFHSTCARLLRANAADAGLDPRFVIFDDADQQAMVKRVAKDFGLDERRFPPRMLQSRINQAKQECRGPEQLERNSPVDGAIFDVYRTYEDRMAAAKAVDFGDLLYRTVLLLQNSAEVLAAYRRRFRHILIDEFQDTNRVQYVLVKLLAGEAPNVCAVGDDDQSIYRWRGADIRNIRDFQRDFPGTVVVKLEQNYRSTGRILDAAHGVISKAIEREPKKLFTENAGGSPVEIETLADERTEALRVVSWTRALRSKGFELGDIAVFYRVHAQSRVIEEALRAANVPYAVYGGMRFYERAEIKDAIAYLRIVQNPHDDVDLGRIINVPPRGIGKSTVDVLFEQATNRGTSLHDAMCAACGDGSMPAATRKRLGSFRDLVHGWRAREADLSPAALLRLILDESGYEKALAGEDTPESDARSQNVAELVGSLEDYEKTAEEPTLAGFLESITLQSVQDEIEEGDRLTLMTVHTAKGLEFRAVMVVGMEEDLFPFRSSQAGRDPHEMDEERRLCYVAITRARERLLLTNVGMRRLFGFEREAFPSRFLEDIPEDSRTVYSPPGRPRSIGPLGRRSAEPAGRTIDRSYSQLPATGEDDHLGFRVGQSVRHARFGVGLVLRVEPGADPKVSVDFPGHGTKTIVARFVQPA